MCEATLALPVCLHGMVLNKAQGQQALFTSHHYIFWICLNWFGNGECYWVIVILLALHNLNLTSLFLRGLLIFIFCSFH
jgi:hypothetical protein